MELEAEYPEHTEYGAGPGPTEDPVGGVSTVDTVAETVVTETAVAETVVNDNALADERVRNIKNIHPGGGTNNT